MRARLALAGETLLTAERREALDAAAANLHSLCSEVAGVPADEAKQLPSGLAISPSDAARCALDGLRLGTFLRGVRFALEDLRSRFAGERLLLLYAGSGPFGALLLPLLPTLDPRDVGVTFVDVHEGSIARLRMLLDELGLSDFVTGLHAADATTFVAEQPPHVVVCEAMQRSLAKEPQVAIVRNLAPQLRSGGVLVPERVTLHLGLAHAASIASDPAGAEVEVLGVAFDLSRAGGVEGETITIPERAVGKSLVLLTDIDVAGPHKLRRGDSGLTVPEVLWNLEVGPGDRVRPVYTCDASPRLGWDVSRG